MAMDMLVDDELSEDRRRELLKSIEEEPDGWRTLSLLFLSRQV
jgi:anti-sigma factor RsiW